jgi:hypothetical protein
MSDRYGQTRIGKIKAAYDDLRAAVRSHNAEAAEAALDRYEQWADYVFAPPNERGAQLAAAIARAERAEAERDALAAALRIMGVDPDSVIRRSRALDELMAADADLIVGEQKDPANAE